MHQRRSSAWRIRTALALVVAVWLTWMPASQGQSLFSPGTYRIEGSADLEARGLHHFMYLHPSGRFLMAGEWAANESSRAAGRWTVSDAGLVLSGTARVSTNQGRWEVPFRRVFRLEGSGDALRLTPAPEKNRFGLLGWPNAYRFFSAKPASTLPADKLPGDEARLLALMDELMAAPAR
jgi:hypothetical protein